MPVATRKPELDNEQWEEIENCSQAEPLNYKRGKITPQQWLALADALDEKAEAMGDGGYGSDEGDDDDVDLEDWAEVLRDTAKEIRAYVTGLEVKPSNKS